MDLKKIQKRLKKELDKERFTHTMGVMYTAAALSMAYGADMEKAMYAGLLHDCAKCIPNDEKLHICIKNLIEVSPSEQKNPFLLHAKLGAFFAREHYKINDPEILHAILVHTTGAPGMNLLDKIIFIADYIEPNRNRAPDLDKVRKTAFQDLNLAMEKILADTLHYLNQEGRDIDPMTSKTYDYFKKKSYSENKEELYDRIQEAGKAGL